MMKKLLIRGLGLVALTMVIALGGCQPQNGGDAEGGNNAAATEEDGGGNNMGNE